MERIQKAETPVDQEILLAQANNAYDTFVNLGPFYGKDIKGQNPSFRVSAEPLQLPESIKSSLTLFGDDMAQIAQVLAYSGDGKLNPDLNFSIPFGFRIDAIIDDNGKINVNEINVSDGADALMVAEQKAYGISAGNSDTTEAYVAYFKSRREYGRRIAMITEKVNINPYVANMRRMSEQVLEKSGGEFLIDVIDLADVIEDFDWSSYQSVIINGAEVTQEELRRTGLETEKIISHGSNSALGNKGLFALIHDPSYSQKLLSSLDEEGLSRLRELLISSEVIQNQDELIDYLGNSNFVVKGSSAPKGKAKLLERGRAVYGPWSAPSEKTRAIELFHQGVSFIAQRFITPKKYPVLLRAEGGKKLVEEIRFNRVCIKYVFNPINKTYEITAAEATLGKDIVPTGRDTCFTAVNFRN